ncbi:sigma-70 family RNA polymerase sigma factor [Rhizobium glycinendophyticum]|uniref:Sigma-70 family RNA polymerase sigma factor n=1 Tax=Rhizobium glycinendophyticum TaxID=2589807 RepID=A0A504U608_9HYPH|nr:sigma-70 family RNA polymerase sigma factor [Rhizobium glycinendophyticum]TPP05436.1 sigma-70 family RNA polymerase sigma factor [Rhizobium glycinendophyticum]
MTTKANPFNVIGQLAALRRYARSLVRNPDEAEDLVHDALVRALERKSSFRSSGSLLNWLMSILHNTHIDRLRSRRASDRRHAAAAELVDLVAPPDQEHSVRLAQVRDAFLALPEDQREALHLVAIEELSYQEAADVLNIPVGTLMSRISRARARLRAMEQGDGEVTVPHLKIVGGYHDDQQ